MAVGGELKWMRKGKKKQRAFLSRFCFVLWVSLTVYLLLLTYIGQCEGEKGKGAMRGAEARGASKEWKRRRSANGGRRKPGAKGVDAKRAEAERAEAERAGATNGR